MPRKPPVIDLTTLPEVDADTASRLLKISLVRFHTMVKAGQIVAAGRNRYALVDVMRGYVAFLENEQKRPRTANEVAAHIDISQRRLFKLIEEGVIERPGPEGFDLDVVRLAYVRHQRKIAAGHGSGVAGKPNLGDERALLAREQRLKVQRENAIAAGRYVNIEAAVSGFESEIRVVREHFITLAPTQGYPLAVLARGARDDETAGIVVTEALRTALYAAMSEFSDPKEIAARGKARGLTSGSEQTTDPDKDEAA
jgi:phage terminase Nu1 subunit (DNA packaging protein)